MTTALTIILAGTLPYGLTIVNTFVYTDGMDNDTKFPTGLFKQVADTCVPPMRRMLAEMELSEDDVSPTMALTADIEIEGKVSRVRVECTLSPEET